MAYLSSNEEGKSFQYDVASCKISLLEQKEGLSSIALQTGVQGSFWCSSLTMFSASTRQRKKSSTTGAPQSGVSPASPGNEGSWNAFWSTVVFPYCQLQQEKQHGSLWCAGLLRMCVNPCWETGERENQTCQKHWIHFLFLLMSPKNSSI